MRSQLFLILIPIELAGQPTPTRHSTALAAARSRESAGGIAAKSPAAHRPNGGRAPRLRLVVSLEDRRVWAIAGRDTLLSAPAAVAKGTTLRYAGQQWTFKTPRGGRRVLRKDANPVWLPPDWMYAETAAQYGLRLAYLSEGKPVPLSRGRQLTVRDGVVGVMKRGAFAALPTDEHIVFGETLFVPPMGTKNRKVAGALGKYRLDLGDGYMLHGTPYDKSIGRNVTHGCIRLRDADIEWLYRHVPVGTAVQIY
jgi:hypothetical protein